MDGPQVVMKIVANDVQGLVIPAPATSSPRRPLSGCSRR